MNLAAAILILGATGHAERSMESTDSIAGIVGQCLGGLVKDVHKTISLHDLWASVAQGRTAKWSVQSPQLAIDGHVREGLRAWGEAVWRVDGYVVDTRSDGSVGLSYRLRIRRYIIATSTAVSDGRVEKVIDAWWTEVVVIPVPKGLRWLLGPQIIRRVPVHVKFSIVANEASGYTRLAGTATGTADTSDFHCRGVRFRIAEPQATASLNSGLRNALAEIERRGRLAYAGGQEIAGLLDKVKLGIKIGVVVGRLRR